MLHVLVITREYIPEVTGGLGVVAAQLARSVSRIGQVRQTVLTGTYGVEVSTSSEGDGEELRVIRLPLGGPWFTSSYEFRARRCEEALRVLQVPPIDIIHVHSVQGYRLAMHLARRFGCPVVYHSHSIVRMEKSRTSQHLFWQEGLYHLASAIVCSSESERSYITKYYPSTADRIVVVPNGVDFIPSPKRSNSGAGYVLYVGRINKAKGLSVLVKSMRTITRRFPDSSLHVVGMGDPKYISQLKKMARTRKIGNRIIFHGFQNPESVSKFYETADVVAMPSFRESFGLVALEAMNHGVPLVVSGTGGLAEVAPENCALQVPPGDSGRLASGILNCLRNSQEALERSQRAREWARGFSWDASAQGTRELYKNVTDASLGVGGCSTSHPGTGESFGSTPASHRATSGLWAREKVEGGDWVTSSF